MHMPGALMGACVFLIWSMAPAFAQKACGRWGAEYVPQNQTISDSYDRDRGPVNRTLSFVLRFEKGDMDGAQRSVFLIFDAYDQKGQKVSTMRFGDSWSNGRSQFSFSTQMGTYGDYEIKSPVSFSPIGVNQDLSMAFIYNAPALIIFPDTHQELTRNSYKNPADWDKYIRFYTKDRVYPDFRGHDFWVRKKCGSDTKAGN